MKNPSLSRKVRLLTQLNYLRAALPQKWVVKV
jgi:hypothetical protein